MSTTPRATTRAHRSVRRRAVALATAALAATTGLIAAGAGPASADGSTITSAGPLTAITTSPTLNCAVNYLGDSAGEWYGGTACATVVATGGKVYGPESIPAGTALTSRSNYEAYTPLDQFLPTGDGTPGSPYVVTTVVRLGDSGLKLTQVDSYVSGRTSYRTDLKLSSTDSSSHDAQVYRAGDCFLQDDDQGTGAVLNGTSPVCKAKSTSAQPNRIVGFFPLTGTSLYLEGLYRDVWTAVGSGVQLPNTSRGSELLDNAVAISWSALAPSTGAEAVFSSLTAFSPEGATPVTLSAQPDQSTSEPGSGNGYTLTVTNPGATAQTLSSITATLPTGFSYTAGSSNGLTSADPAVDGQRLTWTGTFVAPAATDDGPGLATLRFGVKVSSTPGRYTTAVGAEGDGVTVVPATDSAPIQVASSGNRAPVVTLATPAGGAEGKALALKATAKDADRNPLTYAWTATPGAGVDAGASCTFTAPTALKTKVACDDDGTWNIALEVGDGQTQVEQTTTLQVANVPASLKLSVPTPNAARVTASTIYVDGVYVDPGAHDTQSVSITWGDGEPATTGTVVMGTFRVGHSWLTPGQYTVVVTLTDDDGGTVQKSLVLKVKQNTGGGGGGAT